MPTEDPRFWASGISLIAHPVNPQCADRAHEHPHGGHLLALVRRRRRPDPDAQPPAHQQGPRYAAVSSGAWRSPASPPSNGRLPTVTRPGATSISSCKHRNEPRGVGGIFYDWQHSPDEQGGWDADFAMTPRRRPRLRAGLSKNRAGAISTRPGPKPSATSNSIRRGRYVEFNLLYDRGTTFGLKTGGRCRGHPAPRCPLWCVGPENVYAA